MSIRNELLEQIYQATLSGGSTPYYTEATRFIDLTTQTGGAIDTFANVTLGAGGTDAEGLVTADASGVITINKTGPYMVKGIQRQEMQKYFFRLKSQQMQGLPLPH